MPRRLILKLWQSLDGYVERLDGDVLWIFSALDAEAERWQVERLWRADAHVIGGNLYRDMDAHWPRSTEFYTAPMNETPKVAFSSSLGDDVLTHLRS